MMVREGKKGEECCGATNVFDECLQRMPFGRMSSMIIFLKRMNMRILNGILTVTFGLLIVGCSNTPSVEESTSKLRAMNPQTEASPTANTILKDTIRQLENIPAPMDSVTYWKMVRDSCPELFRKVPLSPYEAYDKCKSGYMIGWGCEVGMDDYFQMYAKVLRKRIGKAMEPFRQSTSEAMQLLYFIANKLSGGGTFYSHMLARSEGEIEYSLYKFEKGEIDFKSFDFKKKHDELFRKWKKNIHKSITRDDSMNFTELSDADLEKQLLDSLSRMKSLVKTPFTLTYLDEFGHTFYSDLKF
jgi:hypothetical protein